MSNDTARAAGPGGLFHPRRADPPGDAGWTAPGEGNGRGGALGPAELGARRDRYVLEESVSAVRHAAVNELAALGGMLFRLRRALSGDAAPGARPAALDPTVQEMLQALSDRIAQAPEKLAFRRLNPPLLRPPQAPLTQTIVAFLSASELLPVVRVLPCDDHLQVAIEAQDLEVAIACLVENVLQAAPASDGPRSHPLVTVSVARKDDEIAVMVDDEAEVLSAAFLDKMLEPFFSTRPGALGLGLNVARRIARTYGGDLLLEPRQPRGLHAELRLREADP